jgi:hypothetical protein
MKDTLQNYVGRPKRYENIDGTGEMLFGLMFLGFALAGCLEAGLPENSSRWMHGIVVYGVIIPVLALGYWGRRAVKRRLTWPRTGYVAYPRNTKRWWTVMVAGCLGAVVCVIGFEYLTRFAWRHHVMSVPRIVVSVLYTVPYAFWVFRMNREHPWKWLVLFLMGLGLFTIALFVPGNLGHFGQFMLLLVGFAWFASGAGTLFSYIRHTKPAAPGAE